MYLFLTSANVSYGNFIELKTTNGYKAKYCHLNSFVNVAQKIRSTNTVPQGGSSGTHTINRQRLCIILCRRAGFLPHSPAIPLQIIRSRVPIVFIQNIRAVFISDHFQMLRIDLGYTFCHIGKGDALALADEKRDDI